MKNWLESSTSFALVVALQTFGHVKELRQFGMCCAYSLVVPFTLQHLSQFGVLYLFVCFILLLCTRSCLRFFSPPYLFSSHFYSSYWCSNQLCAGVTCKRLSLDVLFIFCFVYHPSVRWFQEPADPFQNVEWRGSEQNVEQPVTPELVDVGGRKSEVHSIGLLRSLPMGLSPAQWHILPSFCFSHSYPSAIPDLWVLLQK